MGVIKNTFGYKNIWITLKGCKSENVLETIINIRDIKKVDWEEGLKKIETNTEMVMISGPYKEWTLLLGKGLIDATKIENLISLLLELNKYADEVCYICSYRTVSLYGFAKAVNGKIVRMYCYSGEDGHIYANIGEKTFEEKQLKLNFSKDDNELFEDGYDELDEDIIIDISASFSISPYEIIGMEDKSSFYGIIGE